MPVWIFSQTRGTPKKRVGPHLAQGADQLRGVADEVHVAAADLGDVDAEHPLGDVGEGEVGDADVLLVLGSRARRCGCRSRPRTARCGG